MPGKSESLISIEQIDGMIRTIRGTRVMLDRDLAQIYGVPTKVFNQAVKRNAARFPEDFMFRLTKEEAEGSSGFKVTTLNISLRVHGIRCVDGRKCQRSPGKAEF